MASTLYTSGTLVTSDSLNAFDRASYTQLTALGGTADNLTATGPVSMTAYLTGLRFFFTPSAPNTTNVTININGLGNRAITKLGNTLLIAGDLVAGKVAEIVYDGLGFQLLNPQTFNLTNSVPAANITGQVAIANGGTGASTANAAFTALSTGVTLSFRNKIINGNFNINQRVAVSGVSLALNAYFLDRWRSATATNAVTWTGSGNGNIVTIPATEEIEQVIEGNNIEGGVYTLSWTGTATAQVNGVAITNGGQTASLPSNTNVTVKFLAGTVSLVQFEKSTVATVFEQRPFQTELQLCHRYFMSSYPYGTAGGAVDIANEWTYLGTDANTAVSTARWFVPMRAVPTVIATWNPATGVASQARNLTTGAGIALTSSQWAVNRPFSIGSAGGFAAGTGYGTHFHVTAEL